MGDAGPKGCKGAVARTAAARSWVVGFEDSQGTLTSTAIESPGLLGYTDGFPGSSRKSQWILGHEGTIAHAAAEPPGFLGRQVGLARAPGSTDRGLGYQRTFAGTDAYPTGVMELEASLSTADVVFWYQGAVSSAVPCTPIIESTFADPIQLHPVPTRCRTLTSRIAAAAAAAAPQCHPDSRWRL